MKEARLVTDLDKLLMLLTTLGSSNQIPAIVLKWFDNFEHLFKEAKQANLLLIEHKANGIFYSFEEETQFFFYHQKLKHTQDMALLHQALQLSQAHLFELREATQNSFIQLEKSTIALQYIARHQALQQGDLPVLLRLITETLANFSKTSRVSIWEYKSFDGKMGIMCLNLFDLNNQQHQEGGVLLEEDFPTYFAAIKRQRVAKVSQARSNPITIEFLESYLIPNNIFSMLDVPYFIKGELGGVICFEQQEAPRDWTYEDVAFATSMSTMLTIAFLGVLLKQDNQKIELINEELRLQNETLLSQQAKIQEQNLDIHFKNQRLELFNERSKSNEEVLKKAYIKLKENDQRIKEQLHTIEVSNKTLSSSINAAQTIQNAILPQQNILKNFIGEYLLIYKPKNVVSGDFYWYCQHQGSTILTVLDCTGHGVPGAFMTLIGSILLDKIINVQGISTPAEILGQLHQEIERVLRQKETGNNNGIDIAILKIYPPVDNAFDLTFSGAKRPIWYWHAQKLEMFQIQGVRRSIGGEQDESVAFVNHQIHLPVGSLVYLFSDGFADQNDFKRRKLGEERLYSFVAGIVSLPLNQQQALLEELLATQMNNCEQRDDIIFLGFKLGL